jgi:sialate O-acetylesterase
VKGAIWYQGESNAPRAFEYRTLYPTMIKDWRARWKSDLPFIGVQLAPYWDGNVNGVRYAELRDAQLHATKVLSKVGLAVIVDSGNEKDIHPSRKEPVGERLALNARALAYGEKIEYSGPIYKKATFDTGAATITFDHLGGGLVAKDGDLTGFTIAGKDCEFHPAKAIIKGDTVIVSSELVPNPTAVRYGWVNFAKPTLNLFNKAGLPASPFRTDDLPLTTEPKKK